MTAILRLKTEPESSNHCQLLTTEELADQQLSQLLRWMHHLLGESPSDNQKPCVRNLFDKIFLLTCA